MTSVPATKVCHDCGVEKLLDCFGNSLRTKDGYNTQCRDCRNAYLRGWKSGIKRSIDRQSLDAIARRFWSKVDKGDGLGCWLWTGSKDRKGYGRFYMPDHGVTAAQRIGYLLENGHPIPQHLNGCHSCDTPACVRGSHIFPGTQRDNARDMSRKGRGATGVRSGAHRHPESYRGENHSQARLTDDDVREIRRLHTTGMTQTAIADRFGVSRPTITYTVLRKTWTHVL